MPEEGVEHLTLLMRGSDQFIMDKKGTVSRAWRFPSLISMLALMALVDLEAGYRFRSCKRCQRYFRYSHPQAAYCSDRCRWISQKRAQKAKAKKLPSSVAQS